MSIFISHYMASALLLVLFCWIQHAHCCPGIIDNHYGDMTPDPSIENGTRLVLQCSLFKTNITFQKEQYQVDSSMIMFKSNGKYVPSNKIDLVNETVAQYVVNEASPDDNGMYYCKLKIPGQELNRNPVVCVSHVTVGYLPLPVTNFKCVSEHFRNLTCSWEPPFNPIKTSYILEDKGHYTYLNRKCGVVPRENVCSWRTDTVPTFRSGAKSFTFLLTGSNQFGDKTETFTVNHYSIIKPDVPQELKSSDVNRTSVRISWNHPAHIEHDEDVVEQLVYQVRVTPYVINSHGMAKTHLHPKLIDGVISESLLIDDLIPNTLYNVSVRCKTNSSIGDEYWGLTASIIIQTEPDVPYLSPVLIPESFETVKNTEGNRSISLHWKPIPVEYRNAPHFYYKIYYSSLHSSSIPQKPRSLNEESAWSVINVSNANATHYTFNHLKNDDSYAFKILGANSIGASTNFSQIIVEKADKIPHKPTDINVFSLGHGKYELRWNKPIETSYQEITSYTVFWCANLRPRPFSCEGVLDWKKTLNNFETLNLPDAETNYHFAVSANSDYVGASSGISWASCIVPKDGKLDKINQVNVVSQSSTIVKVLWKLECPAQSDVVDKYKIIYCKTGGNSGACLESPIKLDVYDKNATSYILSNLEPFSHYKVTIVAMTGAGPSEESNPQYVKTLSGSPTTPLNVRATLVTQTSMVLEWQSPRQPNGIISYYDVVISDQKERITKSVECLNEKCSSEFLDLNSYSLYNIQVKACVDLAHCGDYSQPVQKRTKQSTPGQMEAPRTEILNTSSIRVSWTPPSKPNGPINYYQLALISRNNETEVLNISGSTNEYYLSFDCHENNEDEEQQHQRYLVKIRAINVGEDEPWMIGEYSESTNTNACLVGVWRSNWFIIGFTAGVSIILFTLVLILYLFVRWIRRTIHTVNKTGIKLPRVLEEPQLVTGNKFEDNDDSKHLDRPDSLNCLTSESQDSFKNRHGSGSGSQASSSSTEVLLSKFNNQHDIKTEGKQHGSVSSNSSHGERHHLSSDSGAEVDTPNKIIIKPTFPSTLQTQAGKVKCNKNFGNDNQLPCLGENRNHVHHRNHSDSSGSKDSGLEDSNSSGTHEKGKRRKKRDNNNKDNVLTLPTTLEFRNPIYDHAFYLYSLLANSEPSLYDLPSHQLEDKNLMVRNIECNQSCKHYKPELAKSIANMIHNPTYNSASYSAMRSNSSSGNTVSSNGSHIYYKYGKWRAPLKHHYVNDGVKNGIVDVVPGHFTGVNVEHNNKSTNGYIALSSLINNNQNPNCIVGAMNAMPSSINQNHNRKKLERNEWSQNSYDAEVSSTSSNGSHSHSIENDVENESSFPSMNQQTCNFSSFSQIHTDCEKIQNDCSSRVRPTSLERQCASNEHEEQSQSAECNHDTQSNAMIRSFSLSPTSSHSHTQSPTSSFTSQSPTLSSPISSSSKPVSVKTNISSKRGYVKPDVLREVMLPAVERKSLDEHQHGNINNGVYKSPNLVKNGNGYVSIPEIEMRNGVSMPSKMSVNQSTRV